MIQSDPISSQHQMEGQLNSHEKEKMPRRVGNPFPQRWKLCYVNLTEYIYN